MMKWPIFQKYVTILNLNATNNRASYTYIKQKLTALQEKPPSSAFLWEILTPILVNISKD